jgi:PDZ domain
MKSTIICVALFATGTCLFPSCAIAQDTKSKPVIVGITLDGKQVLIKLNGINVTATADGVTLPKSQLEKKGNLIIVKDHEGNPVARINRMNNGGTIYRIARNESAAIGIELNPLGKGLADHLDLDPADVIYVTRAIKGRAAAKAGLRDHDVILEIDGRSPANENVLKDILKKKKPGDKMKVRVMRRGKESNFVIRCERAKSDGTRAFDYTFNHQFPSIYGVNRAKYKDSFKKTFDALTRAIAAVKNSQPKEDLQKQLDAARESLRRAQKAVNSKQSESLRQFYGGISSKDLLLSDNTKFLGFNKKYKNNLLFVDPKRSPYFTTGTKRTNITTARSPSSTASLGKKIEKLEKRFDRFERMLKRLLEKKSNN